MARGPTADVDQARKLLATSSPSRWDVHAAAEPLADEHSNDFNSVFRPRASISRKSARVGEVGLSPAVGPARSRFRSLHTENRDVRLNIQQIAQARLAAKGPDAAGVVV